LNVVMCKSESSQSHESREPQSADCSKDCSKTRAFKLPHSKVVQINTEVSESETPLNIPETVQTSLAA